MSEEQQEVHIVLVSNDPNRAYPTLILALGTITMGAKCFHSKVTNTNIKSIDEGCYLGL
jgi:peroxiredoxin family protein